MTKNAIIGKHGSFLVYYTENRQLGAWSETQREESVQESLQGRSPLL